MGTFKLFVFTFVFSLAAQLTAQNFLFDQNSFQLNQKPESSQNIFLERSGVWPYGSSLSIAVDSLRDLIFLGSGGAVLILDGSDKSNPTLISNSLRTYGLVEDIFYDDQLQHLYLACGEGGFEIWDVQNPAQPFNLSRLEILYFGVETPVGHIQVTGNYAVLECGFGYIHTVNISDPANPQQVAFNGLVGNPAHNIHLGTDGRIHATGAQFYTRLNIMPDGSMNSAGGKEFIFGAYDVFGMEDIAFVSDGGNMQILDLLLPGFPAWSITDVGGISHIEVRNDYAYIVNDYGFHIWNVSSVQNPVLAGSFAEEYNFEDLYLAKNFAYVGAGETGLQIFDISDPSNPVELGEFDTFSAGLGIYVKNDIAFLADAVDGMAIIDISDINYPELLSQYQIPQGFMYQVEIRDNIAYTVCWTSGFRIIDVTDPSNPVELAVDESYDVWKLDVAGNYAYVVEAIANAESYVHIYDISNPSNPTEVSSTQFPTTVYEVLYNNGYLYVANEDNGLRILDVSNPSVPVEVSSMDYNDAFDVDIKGNTLYLCAPAIAQTGGGFFTIDITDPLNPVELDIYSDPGFTCFRVKTENGFAYITDGDDVHILDVQNPSAINYLEEYRMPDFAYDLFTKDSLIYVSNTRAGLQILKNTASFTSINTNSNQLPNDFILEQNYPNPFNPSTRIKFTIPNVIASPNGTKLSLVTLKVYDVLGNKVATLVNEYKPAGSYEVGFSAIGGSASGGNAYPLTSGVYFYKLTVDDYIQTKKMILMR